MPIDPSTAKQTQATLRAYEASRQRLVSAQEEGAVVKATEDMLAAKRNHKAAVERAELALRNAKEKRD
jgi:hypothetical protein